MNTCPNCGKVAGLHSSILQGCMCQYSMQEPPQRTWVDLTPQDYAEIFRTARSVDYAARLAAAKLKEKNT